MRVAIVDYSGHAFPLQLARALALRGHQILYLHFREFQSPHGALQSVATDPAALIIKPVTLGKAFPKYSFVRRRFHEIDIGKAFAARIETFAPDIVIAGNCPLDCALAIGKSARLSGRKFIFWQQDIYSTAIGRILGRKFGIVGQLIGRYYRRVERRILTMADATVVISQDFVDSIRTDFAMPTGNVHVIENWAPLGDIPMRPKDNAWSRRHALREKTVVLYSGTIGLKHDPRQILDLAVTLSDRPDVKIVVVSEGPFADWLTEASAEAGLTNIVVLPFQPYAEFPDVLGSADLTIAVLEQDAGAFSVPSKVLSYLCAGRPIVLSAPPENLAARIISGAGAGLTVAAGDRSGFVAAVQMLIADRPARLAAGRQARLYAEKTFDIASITTRFEMIFNDALGHCATSMSEIAPPLVPAAGVNSPATQYSSNAETTDVKIARDTRSGNR